jgi:hypothetical protein
MTDTTNAAPGDAPAAPTPEANVEGIPAKFITATGEVNVAELLKSYTELEQRQSSQQNPAAPEANHDAAQQAVENAGLDWGTLVGKVSATGGLEDSDFAALEQVGIPKAIVDNYLTLTRNENTRQTELAHQHVGGEANMTELLGWAAQNLAPAEIAHYNTMLGTRDGWKPALDVIAAKMSAAAKTAGEPRLQGGVSAPRNGEGGYSSRAAMMKDMASPQYQTDPAFRAKVAQKLAGSRFENDER